MIRVFVVDDEKLVRRGIIGLIDWEKYGMEVVGDSDRFFSSSCTLFNRTRMLFFSLCRSATFSSNS